MRDWKMTWITQAAIDEQKRADDKKAAEATPPRPPAPTQPK